MQGIVLITTDKVFPYSLLCKLPIIFPEHIATILKLSLLLLKKWNLSIPVSRAPETDVFFFQVNIAK